MISTFNGISFLRGTAKNASIPEGGIYKIVLPRPEATWSVPPGLFDGIKAFVSAAAAMGPIAGAVYILASHSLRDMATATIACRTLAILWRWKVPEPVIVAGSGIAGLLLYSSVGGR